MSTVNERILEAQIKHSIYLKRYKGGVLKQIIGLLNNTEADLIDLIASLLASIEGVALTSQNVSKSAGTATDC